MLLIVVHAPPPLIDCSQRTTVPVCPLNVNVPLLPFEQTVALLLTVPPTDNGFTVMVETVEKATQLPLVILARY